MHAWKEKSGLIIPLFILALGFILRMGWPTLAEFKRDEATVARLAQAIAYEGYRPVIGVDSSLGIDNLPLTLYMMALPLRLWSDPTSAVLFTGFLNSLALVACYAVGKTFFNRKVALIATWLFATNPWAILYARKIWCRTLPIFTLAFMASLFYTFVRGKRWALVGAFAGLAGLLGIQLEGLAFVPILVFALVAYHDRVSWKPLGVGCGLFALALAPYGVHDALNAWENLRMLLNYSAGGGTFSLDAMRYALMLTGSAGIEGQAGAYHIQFQEAVPALWWMNTGMMILTLAALLYALHEAIRGKTPARRRTFTLLSLWFWVPVALQLRPGDATQIHYFVTHYPGQFLLIASMLVAGLKRLTASPWTQYFHKLKLKRLNLPLPELLLILALLIWGGWQTAVAAQRLHFMVIHPTTGGYGIPLRYTRRAALAAKRLADAQETPTPTEIIVLSQETQPLATEVPSVFDALLFGHPHRFADISWTLPLSQEGHNVYLLGPIQGTNDSLSGPIQARLESITNVKAGPTIPLPSGDVEPDTASATNTVRFLTYRYTSPDSNGDRTDMLTGMQRLSDGVLFANKVVFAAYEIPETANAGTSLDVWLAWWLQGPPPSDQDYHFTIQLLGRDGTLQSQCDHAGFPARFWQAGDLVISYFSLPIPDKLHPGFYAVQAGMYTYPNITGVPVVDHQGTPLHPGLKLTEINVTP